jgi:hypothetical protein
MPFEWKLASLDELKGLFLDTSLQDSHVRVNLATAKVEQPISLGLEGLSFVVDGGSSAAIEAFNSPGDVDPDGVVGDKPTQEELGRLSPPLVLGQDAWLKYAVRARAKAKAGMNIPFLSGSASGEVTLQVADYHLHALTERLRDAINADARNLRLPLVLDHVLKLQPKEALSFQARTRLDTSVSLQWADVFTTNLNALSQLLPRGTLLSLKTSAGATVTGSIQVTDDFLITFSREKAGAVVVSVQKGAVRDAKLAAQVGITVESAVDPQVLGGVFDALVGLPGVARFEQLVDKVASTQLSDEEKKVLRLVLDRLGLKEYEADPSALKKAWEAQKARARQAVVDMAAQKLSSGFQYEYARLSEQQTLLRLEVTDSQLQQLHTPLVMGRLTQVLKQVEPGAVRSYFLQDTRTSVEAWGFSLGFAKWRLLQSQSLKKLQRVTQYGSPDHLHGPRRHAYVGVRSYEGGLFQGKGRWSIDFKCDMGEFRAQPTVRDFNYGLYLQVQRQGELSEGALRQAIDEAVIWHVLDDADEELVLKEVQSASKGETVEIRLEMKLADTVFREMTAQAGIAQPELFAKALARAMPWDTSRARSSAEFRQSVYAPLWMAYLTEKAKDWTPKRAAERAEAWLKQDKLAKGVGGEVAYWEGQGTAYPNTFADVLDKNSRLADVGGQYGGTYIRWQRLVAGMALLRDGLQQGADPSLLERVFEELEELWNVSFHVKAFGAMLLELSSRSVQGLKAVERTLTVTKGSSGQKEQILFSASREG